jgi:uncharacterized membrane protein HdeD (DUF308 family)
MAASATSFETHERPWWLTLINGILAAAIGAILLFAAPKQKIDTYLVLVTVLGFYWVFKGIMDIVLMFIDHTGWAWKLFMGLISIIAGSYILMYPIAAAVMLPKIFVLVLGIWGLIDGIVLLIMAFKGAGWGSGILGVLGILFGIFLIANYTMVGMGLTFLWLASIFALVGGVVMIVQAFRSR